MKKHKKVDRDISIHLFYLLNKLILSIPKYDH